MNTKLIPGIASTLALIAVLLLIRETVHRRALDVTLDDANRECETLATLLRAAQRQAALAEKSATLLEAALNLERETRKADEARTAAVATQARSRSTPSSGGPPREAILAGKEFMARHPDVRHAVTDLYRAQTAAQFSTVFRSLGFSPEQIERFENLMMQGAGVTRMVAGPDGQMAILSVSSWDQDRKSDDTAQLIAMLGPDGIQQVREAIQSLPVRRLVSQLGGSLYATATPLSPEQAEQLTRAVISSGAMRSQAQPDWRTLLAHSQPFLSPPQHAVLGGLQAEEEYQLALRQAMRPGAPSPRK